MGAALVDFARPNKSHLLRSQKPIMEPEADYEKNGFFGDVVFGCGGILIADQLTMYYGVGQILQWLAAPCRLQRFSNN